MIKFFGNGSAPKWLVATASAVAAVVVLFLALVIFTYANGNIFPGVSAGGVSLSGKTEEEARALLDGVCEERYTDAVINIKIEDLSTVEAKAAELGIKLSSEETAREAYAIGHEGGFFERVGAVLGALFGGGDVPLSVSFSEEAYEDLTERLTKHDIAAVDADYTIEDDKLFLHPRADGKTVDVKKAVEELSARFAAQDYSDMEISREVAPSVALDIDKVYSEVHAVAADAYLEKGEDGNKIVPHVVGMDFDLSAARAEYEKDPGRVIEIPLTITMPKIQTKHLETNLFKYCLARVETYFSPKKVERTANVRLAAKLVNGTILNPGEEFSYNRTVGPRTTARGFREAAIFSQGEVVDGIGGGICQVSSTIYMAALKANMKIVERKNHAFYVDYTPKGEDATVVYGSIDFRFKNTSAYPIKIVATSKNNYIRIELMGTEPDEVRTVKLTKKTHSTTPYTTRIKETNTLKKGERVVDQKGQEGLSMSVYRNVYDKNGKLVESYLENNSKYKPMPEIVLVGTAVAAGSGESVETTAPVESVTPPAEEVPSTPTEEAPPSEENPEATPETPAPAPAPEDTPANEEAPAEQPSGDAPDWIGQ